jgi:hypothetical protein
MTNTAEVIQRSFSKTNNTLVAHNTDVEYFYIFTHAKHKHNTHLICSCTLVVTHVHIFTHMHTHKHTYTYSELPVTLWQPSIISGQALAFHMRFESVAVISVTLWCHLLQSMVSILQRRHCIALKQKLPTILHGIK